MCRNSHLLLVLTRYKPCEQLLGFEYSARKITDSSLISWFALCIIYSWPWIRKPKMGITFKKRFKQDKFELPELSTILIFIFHLTRKLRPGGSIAPTCTVSSLLASFWPHYKALFSIPALLLVTFISAFNKIKIASGQKLTSWGLMLLSCSASMTRLVAGKSSSHWFAHLKSGSRFWTPPSVLKAAVLSHYIILQTRLFKHWSFFEKSGVWNWLSEYVLTHKLLVHTRNLVTDD